MKKQTNKHKTIVITKNWAEKIKVITCYYLVQLQIKFIHKTIKMI